MSTAPTQPMTPSVDPAFIAAVVRQVIARLKSGVQQVAADAIAANEVATAESVISVSTINELPSGTEVLRVSESAVVTPAACDEARWNGLKIQRGAEPTASTALNHRKERSVKADAICSAEIVDRDATGIGQAVWNQLGHRGITSTGGATVVLTARPAAEVISQCRIGHDAIVVRSVGDVDRFAAETGADTFVIDTTESNLIAAVNIAARVCKLQVSKSKRGAR